MAYVFITLLINLILFWHEIDGAIINCTVYPIILQQLPNRIVGTLSISNSSNEEIFWDHVQFEIDAQFPLNFVVPIEIYNRVPDRYILQLHIYQLPRINYDLPLWSADSIDNLTELAIPNFVIFRAHSDRKPHGPSVMGVILSLQPFISDLSDHKLMVKVGSMPPITLQIHKFMSNFPVLFMINDIPLAQRRNNTAMVSILITDPKTIIAYEGRERAVFTNVSEYSTLLFRVSEERAVNLTVIMSAHVFTSISLFQLGATYRIYREGFLLFERSEVIDTLEFPFITLKQLVPITTPTSYSIEATIFGPVTGFPFDMTLFEGVTYARLVPGTDNKIKISMRYTGPKIGTTIIGTIRQAPPNLDTWPLVGSNLAFVINGNDTNLAEADQFIIFDQTFPIQFTLLDIQTVTRNYQEVVFTVTITYLDATVIWAESTINNQILYNNLNRLDINVTRADGYACITPGGGYCTPSPSDNVTTVCCSQYKCSQQGQCNVSW